MPQTPASTSPRRARRGQLLYVKAEWTLASRLLLVLVLFGVVIAVLWLDRDGLKDHLDGHLSFADIVYFAVITITTVGYGDIVPVASHSRVIDALFITPVRIFIWLIFLGTAYQLVIQRVVEEFRMSRLRDRLNGHIIICGFGETGRVAAKEIVAKGTAPDRIVVIDISEQCLREAADQGYIGLHGDPTHERVLRDAGVERARAVIVSLGRDDSTVLTVLTIRSLTSTTRVISVVWEDENVKLIRRAGANATVMPSQAGGYLLADAVSHSFVTDYVFDLLTSGGRVALVERKPHPDEVGKSMRELERGLVVRLYRDGQPIGFWESARNRIERDDLLLVIEPGPL
ncbi:MAG TPA: potassium channel family protein [Burkholderiales bacterium]|nr:potassium channel family protein [Burkholderiales bacterium]